MDFSAAMGRTTLQKVYDKLFWLEHIQLIIGLFDSSFQLYCKTSDCLWGYLLFMTISLIVLHAYISCLQAKGAQGTPCSYQLSGKVSDERSAALTSISLFSSQHQKAVVTVGSSQWEVCLPHWISNRIKLKNNQHLRVNSPWMKTERGED